MSNRKITEQTVRQFRRYLLCEEKSSATIGKYLRDVRALQRFLEGEAISRERLIAWKDALMSGGYAVRSVNSMLASVNCLLRFLGREDCRVKNLKTQRKTYCMEENELTKGEYLRLLQAAKDRPRLKLIMETICGTGIRVSELSAFTVEAVRVGQVEIRCKGKIRMILIPGKLQKLLLRYARREKIGRGRIFVTRSGRPLSRSYIWAQMKRLCGKAGVPAGKVFPHNLRKLFARVFYSLDKDIAKLADVLGHSSINTTRIYIMTTGSEHRRQLERLGLVI